jgi:hypothetical protein
MTAVFWLTYQTATGVCVALQPGFSLIHARMAAAVNELEPGEFIEGHQLDAKTIKKIPKNMIGTCLSSKRAEQLLKKLAN